MNEISWMSISSVFMILYIAVILSLSFKMMKTMDMNLKLLLIKVLELKYFI